MAISEDETSSIIYEEELVRNSRGMKLFTCRWVPTSCEPKALIFLCHGYAMECSVSMKGTARRLIKAGYAVYGMDYEGHGKSEGLQGFVPSFDAVVTDCSQHYSNICERQENVKRMRILLGESMGGAMALLLHRKMPHFWDGAVLVAPMCKIAEEMKPPAIVLSVLKKCSKIIPTWKIIPTQDIIDAAFRDPAIRKEVRSNPLCYKGRPRLQTGYQLLSVSLDLERRLDEVTLPFIVTHGEEDIVTDPSVSKLLHEKASSTDKTLKLYPGMWHSLTYGELPENIDAVFSDIIGWLDQRVSMGNSRLEKLQKNANDTLLFKPQNDSLQ
ncbi:caffeoylshikimate esterase-like isoform X2 [Ipomoea triloba]|uniref:caffeoylshikimate esterase-like isoform X2 n=1 Tax=Ipomoea triloba TaxID=35885 RepID=UPI00125D73AD|nr:caffeoylshikimate esterase-like isoform X2 [Ipomoea triloba]